MPKMGHRIEWYSYAKGFEIEFRQLVAWNSFQGVYVSEPCGVMIEEAYGASNEMPYPSDVHCRDLSIDDYGEMKILQEQVVHLSKSVYGEENVKTLAVMHELSVTYWGSVQKIPLSLFRQGEHKPRLPSIRIDREQGWQGVSLVL
jgi:hypothetical protein